MTTIIDNVLTVELPGCTMQVDINELIATTGVKSYYRDSDGHTYYQTITKQSEARRILKFLLPFLDPEDIDRLTKEFRANPDLLKIWEGLKK